MPPPPAALPARPDTVPPAPFYEADGIVLYCGDCRDVLPALEGVTACVTDPPYDLTTIARTLQMKGSSVDPRTGRERSNERRRARGFMGKAWDGTGVAFEPETWAHVSDALLPGAPLLAFGGTRTFHRLTCAIEDAGFEIRDDILNLYSADEPAAAFLASLDPHQRKLFDRAFPAESLASWLYGTGFPKSHNVSKALDKAAGAEREVVGTRAGGMTPKPNGAYNFNGRDVANGSHYADSSVPVTAPATPLAALWEGYGTALKPGWEPVVLAMKPIKGPWMVELTPARLDAWEERERAHV